MVTAPGWASAQAPKSLEPPHPGHPIKSDGKNQYICVSVKPASATCCSGSLHRLWQASPAPIALSPHDY